MNIQEIATQIAKDYAQKKEELTIKALRSKGLAFQDSYVYERIGSINVTP